MASIPGNCLFRGVFITALLSLLMDTTRGITIEVIPTRPIPNSDVTLKVKGVIGTIRSFSWYNGSNPSASNQILNYIPSLTPPQTKGHMYFDQAEALANGSLLIKNFVKTFEGFYTVQIQAESPLQASVSVTMSEHATAPSQHVTSLSITPTGIAPLGASSTSLLIGALLFYTLNVL
ncbi:carcinoembryonic antigen-related cell adhesion molecule 19 isoform X3 [Xenopus laevis]|uniref:Carcinoembryonic antigen-related cell adhesion molecule 19 isoform X3 n=1 Tax=Xenopus laevis TaxID=8355 RepID=A0A8J1LD85_XENLA|nr:carcinoembryonic antigen-related cell adhesion molecule 19 isoform X3 [Xenopus laevis]